MKFTQILLAGTFLGSGLFAGSASWIQDGGNWSEPSNWDPNTVPNSSSDVATFTDETGTFAAANVDGTFSVAGLNFTDALAFALNNGTLNIFDFVNVGMATGGTSCNTPIFIQNDISIVTDAQFSCASIAGSGGIIKTGSDVLRTTGPCTYSGTTYINEGTYQAGFSDAFSPNSAIVLANVTGVELNNQGIPNTILSLSGGGNLGGNVTFDNVDAGSLTLGDSNNTEYAGMISGRGELIKRGSGTFTLTGTNTYTEGTTISEGTLNAQNNSALGTGDLIINDAATLIVGSFTLSNAVTLSGTNTIFVDAEKIATLSGVMSSTGGLVKSGSGILVLTGTNTYTGGSSIVAGTLKAENNSALGTGLLSINNTATFATDNFTLSKVLSLSGTSTILTDTGITTTLSGVLLGSGNLTKSGSGTLLLSAVNTFTGTTLVSSGILGLVDSGSISDSSAVSITGTLDIAGTTSGASINNLSGPGIINLGSKVLTALGSSTSTFSGVIEGNGQLIKSGPGTLILSGTNTYMGGTEISEGIIYVENNNALGTGNLTISTPAESPMLPTNAALDLMPGVIVTNDMTLSGTGKATINVESSADDKITILTGDIAGDGGLIKTGFGTLRITASNHTFTGGLTINRGSVQINGSILSDVLVQDGGALEGTNGTINGNIVLEAGAMCQPGNSIGNIPVVGDVTFESGSQLNIEVDNTANSSMTISGILTIESNVNLEFNIQSGFTELSKEFSFISANSILGTFDSVTTNNPLSKVLSINYVDGEVSIKLGLFDVTKVTSNSNALNVGSALSTLINNGNTSFDDVITSLLEIASTEGLEAMSNALDQMQPAMFKGLTITQENNAVKIQDTLGYRFEQVLNQVHCYKSRNRVVEECKTDEKKINVWASGFGDLLYQGSNKYAGSPQVGYQSNTGGVSLGLDGHFAKYLYAGALGAYTSSDINWHNHRGNGSVETGYAGLYFSAIGDLFYGNLSVIGGWSHYDAKRNIEYTGMNLTAKNSHGGVQLLSHVDTGLNLGTRGFTIRPFDSFDYISQTENKFTETGAGVLNLDVRKSNAIMLRNELGVQFASCLCFASSKWTIAPKASWVREVRIKGENFTSSFVNTVGVTFSSTGYFSNRSLFSPGVLITGLMWKDRLSLEIYYNGEYCHNYSDNNYGGQIRFGF